ncbi:hypothetical protein CDL12_21833 [Handroanthus impetiginosus]|uniref:BZIP domain-containing protein n=1 Tax=Handroanthus impetiginosus TaxID=429701 RepID=A0A2G9GK28_9LAMI|nr:hypothetical protein CDL12_21833 [Handroanthus impetiginosus]
MVDREFVEDELPIDWDGLLDNIPDDLNYDLCDQPLAGGLSNSLDSGCFLSIDDIEQFLINDDFSHPEEKDENTKADGVFSDVLLDSSPGSGSDSYKECSTSPGPVFIEADEDMEKQDKPHQNGAHLPQSKENNVAHILDDDGDDPVAKKRKRQMRNRDAAVRSRERKKMYVRDLEMKSKYFEAECKRLGFMLQCCLAENQALRLSMHNSKAFDASMTKQESAVLLLESLLLGSLLGFLGIMCLLILPSQLLSTLEAGLLENGDSAGWRSVAPRKAESNVSRVVFHSFMVGKTWKASRSRMKLTLSTTEAVL